MALPLFSFRKRVTVRPVRIPYNQLVGQMQAFKDASANHALDLLELARQGVQ